MNVTCHGGRIMGSIKYGVSLVIQTDAKNTRTYVSKTESILKRND